MHSNAPNTPVGLVLPVLLIVDSSHLLTDGVGNLLDKVWVPSSCQPNRLRKEGSFFVGAPGLPHAMEALYMTLSYRSIFVSEDK